MYVQEINLKHTILTYNTNNDQKAFKIIIKKKGTRHNELQQIDNQNIESKYTYLGQFYPNG